jgi:methylmalonyl-CoA/ethylmalonyl-CoA epimerase
MDARSPDARSPLDYLGGGLQQVAFVVKDLTAGMEFFNRTMGVARFYVIEDFGRQARETTFRGRPVEHNFKLALAYSGDTQIELIQHLSGETCYKEHLERRGEGLHHLGFFLYDLDAYQSVLDSLGAGGYAPLMSGRFGTTRYTYFDTEAAIGSIMEIVYLDSGGKDFMAKIKSGEF